MDKKIINLRKNLKYDLETFEITDSKIIEICKNYKKFSEYQLKKIIYIIEKKYKLKKAV